MRTTPFFINLQGQALRTPKRSYNFDPLKKKLEKIGFSNQECLALFNGSFQKKDFKTKKKPTIKISMALGIKTYAV
jgi:hypothetical protein